MEAAFSLPPSDPLSSDPSEPFELVLWRGGSAKRLPNCVKLHVRAFTRRKGEGCPVGLLLIQEDTKANDEMRSRTAADQDVLALREMLDFRDEEAWLQEETIRAQRDELNQLYNKLGADTTKTGTEHPTTRQERGAASARKPLSRRVSFSKTNRVTIFAKSSSPADFIHRLRHEETRAQVMPPSDFAPKEAKMKQ